tara:strand:- start:1145 stop:2461 length:1317 start_codon:yes stop_codon:yes gene_type:complete
MAAQFDSAPAETYVPANQVLMYTISDDGGAVSASHRFIVVVFENATQIAKLYLTANTNNKAHFDLSQIVKHRLKVDNNISDGTLSIFDMAAKIDHSTVGTRRFRVRIGTFDGTSETLNEASKYIYLVDGTQQISEGLHPSFAKYYPTGTSFKGWLTERWDDKEVSGQGINSAVDYYFADNDEGVVAWIHDDTVISGDDERVYYQLYNDAGTLGTLDFHRISSDGGNTLADTNYDQKLHFTGLAPASLRFTSTNLPSHANNSSWTYYLLWLADTSANRKSKYIRVYKDCGVYKNERVQIAYANRLGGWDYLNFDGNADKLETVENKPFYKQLGDYDAATFSFATTARNKEPYQITAKQSYTLKSNSFKKEEFYQLEGLLRSSNVFMRYGDSDSDTSFLIDRDKWLPVIVDTKSLTIRDKAQSRIFDVSVKVTLAQDIRC